MSWFGFGKKQEQAPMQQQQQAPMQQQQQQQMTMPFQQMGGGDVSGGLRRLPIPNPTENEGKSLVSTIVTICIGSSYDALFTLHPQESPDGKVHVWAVTSINSLRAILDAFEKGGESNDPLISDLMIDLRSEKADVLFNWECCSGCSGNNFDDPALVSKLLKLLLDRGAMCMFSDFSLGAIIKHWDSSVLGKNPFRQIGTFSDSMDLRFEPQVLKDSPSSQLQAVGDLCVKGEAFVHAMGGTVAYTVDNSSRDMDAYDLQILSIQTRAGHLAFNSADKHKIGEHQGAPCHVLLSYPEGGQILLSSCHWVEIVKLDVTEEKLIQHAAEKYGAAYSEDIQQQLSSAAPTMRAQMVQDFAKSSVQKSAPSRRQGKFSKKGW